jgi:endonuclease/exonuclease/phosphatase family metal-dependent hydrolase
MGQGISAVGALRAPFAKRFQHEDVVSGCIAADILCLQELLSRDAQQFFDGLPQRRFTSRFRDDNRVRFGGRMTMRGSGLGIGAGSPLTKTIMRTFAGARVGWDRLARKGALYTQLSFRPDASVDLMTVHLQAGPGAHAAAVRAVQLADLKDFVRSVGAPDRPFIVCGDFNIDGLAPARAGAEYRSLAAALNGFQDLGAAADLSTFDPHPQGNALARAFEPGGRAQRLDYIFFRPARGPIELRCKQLDIFFDKPLGLTTRLDGTAAWASDHYGLSATFECEGLH